MTYNSNMTEMKRRVDEFGRAFAGSQLQIQTYVNCRRGQLDAAILNALPELAERGASLEWVSPLAEKRFVECHDGSFLSALGLQDSAGLLVEFWPKGIHLRGANPRAVLDSYRALGFSRTVQVPPEGDERSLSDEEIIDRCADKSGTGTLHVNLVLKHRSGAP